MIDVTHVSHVTRPWTGFAKRLKKCDQTSKVASSMSSMLAEVRDAVDQASGSAHRVARMQGGLRKAGKVTAKRAALYGIIAVLTASIGELRVVAGTLAVWPWTLFVASFAAMYVRAFVAQWRQHWQRRQTPVRSHVWAHSQL